MEIFLKEILNINIFAWWLLVHQSLTSVYLIPYTKMYFLFQTKISTFKKYIQRYVGQFHCCLVGLWVTECMFEKLKFSKKNNESWQMESKTMENVIISYWVPMHMYMLYGIMIPIITYPIYKVLHNMFQASDYFFHLFLKFWFDFN